MTCISGWSTDLSWAFKWMGIYCLGHGGSRFSQYQDDNGLVHGTKKIASTVEKFSCGDNEHFVWNYWNSINFLLFVILNLQGPLMPITAKNLTKHCVCLLFDTAHLFRLFLAPCAFRIYSVQIFKSKCLTLTLLCRWSCQNRLCRGQFYYACLKEKIVPLLFFPFYLIWISALYAPFVM